MELVSPPDYVEEVVTDLEIAFNNPQEHISLTLRGGDVFQLNGDQFIIALVSPPGTLVVNKVQILWFSQRERTIRTPVKQVGKSSTSTEPLGVSQ